MLKLTRQQGTPYIKMSTNKANIHKYIIVLLERYNIPTRSAKVYFCRDHATLHNDDSQNEDKLQ